MRTWSCASEVSLRGQGSQGPFPWLPGPCPAFRGQGFFARGGGRGPLWLGPHDTSRVCSPIGLRRRRAFQPDHEGERYDCRHQAAPQHPPQGTLGPGPKGGEPAPFQAAGRGANSLSIFELKTFRPRAKNHLLINARSSLVLKCWFFKSPIKSLYKSFNIDG